jgi:hypothetical protein
VHERLLRFDLQNDPSQKKTKYFKLYREIKTREHPVSRIAEVIELQRRIRQQREKQCIERQQQWRNAAGKNSQREPAEEASTALGTNGDSSVESGFAVEATRSTICAESEFSQHDWFPLHILYKR